jgi:hypothetical protein
MPRLARVALAVALLALGIAGKLAISGQEPGFRVVRGSDAVSTTLLGGLRAVPLIALWDRSIETGQREDWVAQLALFDLISELTPRTAAAVHMQARTEALRVADEQQTRPDAWRWIQSAVQRLHLGRGRTHSPALMDEGLWTLGYYCGDRFPAEMAAILAAKSGDEALAAQADAAGKRILASKVALAWLDGPGLAQRAVTDASGVNVVRYWDLPKFQDLSEDDAALIVVADRLRWLAMAGIAKRGATELKGTRSELVLRYVLTKRHLCRLEPDEPAQLRHRRDAAEVLENEMARLSGLGDHELEQRFLDEAHQLLDSWTEQDD